MGRLGRWRVGMGWLGRWWLGRSPVTTRRTAAVAGPTAVTGRLTATAVTASRGMATVARAVAWRRGSPRVAVPVAAAARVAARRWRQQPGRRERWPVGRTRRRAGSRTARWEGRAGRGLASDWLRFSARHGRLVDGRNVPARLSTAVGVADRGHRSRAHEQQASRAHSQPHGPTGGGPRPDPPRAPPGRCRHGDGREQCRALRRTLAVVEEGSETSGRDRRPPRGQVRQPAQDLGQRVTARPVRRCEQPVQLVVSGHLALAIGGTGDPVTVNARPVCAGRR
jgi:hypothetical protein